MTEISGIVSTDMTVDMNTYRDDTVLLYPYCCANSTPFADPGMAAITTRTPLISGLIGKKYTSANTIKGKATSLTAAKAYMIQFVNAPLSGLSAKVDPTTIMDSGTVASPMIFSVS